MAVRIPLVLVNGQVQQLQAGDTLSSGGLNIISGSTTFAFPAAGSQEDSFVINTIANATLTNALFKTIAFVPTVSTDHDSLDDFSWDGLDFNIENIVDGVSFDLRCTAGNNSWGNYNLNYLIGY